jgi:glutathione S-transferase
MTLIIYGTHRSRTMRVLWTAAELGLDFTHVPLAVGDSALQERWFLDLNPAGAIPTIVDDGFALSESLAINLYLVKKYGTTGVRPLQPPTLQGEADTWRWSLWAQGHLEPWIQRDGRLGSVRAAVGDLAAGEINAALDILDRRLSDRVWLVDEHFTVADLNVACVLSPSRTEHVELQARPRVHEWLARCHGRPAAIATRRRFAS